MASGKKISHAEWFGEQEDESNSFGGPAGFGEQANKIKPGKNSSKSKDGFSKKIFDSKEGRLLLELQKTYKGDERFRLDKRFKNDVEYEKLPNNVKLVTRDIIAEENYANERERENEDKLKKAKKKSKPKDQVDQAAGEKDEIGEAKAPEIPLSEEREKQKNILMELLPGEKIFSKSAKLHSNKPASYIVPRFDPNNQKACQAMIIKKEKKPETKLKKLGFQEPKIESGIDKARKNLMKANYILGRMKEKTGKADNDVENEDTELKPKIKKLRKINYSKWKEIIEDKSEAPKKFSLFS